MDEMTREDAVAYYLERAAEWTGQDPERLKEESVMGLNRKSEKMVVNLGLAVTDLNELAPEDERLGADPVGSAMPIPKFKVGAAVFLDGRDADAMPPLTIKRINIWDAAERTKVLRMLRHGTRVKVMARKFDRGRWNYRVRYELKPGWIPEAFLSSQKPDILGEFVL